MVPTIIHRTGVTVEGGLKLQVAELVAPVTNDTQRVRMHRASRPDAVRWLISLGTSPYGIAATEHRCSTSNATDS